MSTFDLVGPFEHHDVLVNGRRVPFLEAHPWNGGLIHLVLDRRFGLDVSVADAERVVPFVADCIAVALGYTCHPGTEGVPEPLRSHPFTIMHGIELGGAVGEATPATGDKP